jgi:hypothetical protein
LAAIGPSGSGKSSLVRAGLLPELYGGTMAKAGSKWHVILMQPGGSPISNLAAALLEGDLHDPDEEDILAWVKTTLLRSGLGLTGAVRQSQLPTGTNLLVVVDQFEEMFRFSNKARQDREEASAFVNLLLEASHQPDQRIYVVLTMRSDFLGDCAQYRGLAEAINEGEYLIPRLSRDQWRSAIEGPVRVGGGEIAPRLVQRLLNDVGEDPDQLPILQHALSQIWLMANRGADEMDLIHYAMVGGMPSVELPDEDLVRFNSWFNNLPEYQQKFQRIFRHEGVTIDTIVSPMPAKHDTDTSPPRPSSPLMRPMGTSPDWMCRSEPLFSMSTPSRSASEEEDLVCCTRSFLAVEFTFVETTCGLRSHGVTAWVGAR